jgi:hypothetical protein
VPGFEPGISRVQAAGGSLVEFPVSTYPLLGRNWPIGGGGYFRLLPGALHRGLFASLERLGRPTATYLHPWEVDPDQPRVDAPVMKRFRHRVGLGSTLSKLDAFLQRFPSVPMEDLLVAHGHLE